jgi:hypothetical protein
VSADVFTRGAIIGDRAEVIVETHRRAFDTVERRRRRAGDRGARWRRASSTGHGAHRCERRRLLSVPLAWPRLRPASYKDFGGESLDDTARSRAVTGLR